MKERMRQIFIKVTVRAPFAPVVDVIVIQSRTVYTAEFGERGEKRITTVIGLVP